MAKGYPYVCAFVKNRLDSKTLWTLSTDGAQLITLRSAGFNHVNLEAARDLGFRIVRVPEYSPYAVAEHEVTLFPRSGKLLC